MRRHFFIFELKKRGIETSIKFFPCLTGALVCALFYVFPADLVAATILEGNEFDVGCTHTVSGVIEAGDVSLIEPIVQMAASKSTFKDKRRICLDSPGGSLSEALKIASLFQRHWVGTSVPSGSECSSACAIIFMSGTMQIDDVIIPHRILGPSGLVGFHAPSLNLEDRTYSRVEVNTAYTVAIESIAEILERFDERDIRSSLLLEMVSTPPDKLRYIKTVGDASRWGVVVWPVQEPTSGRNEAIWSACSNAEAFIRDSKPLKSYDRSGREKIRARLVDGNDDTRFSLRLGFFEEAAEACTLIFSSFGSVFPDFSFQASAEFQSGGVASVYRFMFHPEDTLISNLATNDAPTWKQVENAFRFEN